jgi:hypothetical protein
MPTAAKNTRANAQRAGKELAKERRESPLEGFRDVASKAKGANQLAEIGFGDILKQLEAKGEVMSSSEMGNGWAILSGKEKARLCGVSLLVLAYNFNDGDNGEFVSAQVVTNSERLIVNDGSTGIYQQLKDLSEAGETRAIYCKRGLKRSDYTFTDPKTKEEKEATTFYLDTSA